MRDSKSLNSAVENIYKEEYDAVVKKECVGHVQKRLDTALRTEKKKKG